MRSILPAGFILVLTLFLCGCIQSPSAPTVTPAETSGVSVLIPPDDTTTTPHPRMAVIITAEETPSSVIVRIEGGDDAAALTSLNIRITNLDGSTIQRTILSPVIAKPYVFMYRGYASAAKVNIVGTFSDGYQQTLLMTSL
jgi:hypothetical protein